MQMNKLILRRFCGEEIYPIKEAIWSILKGDGTWDDPYSLWLEVSCGTGEKLNEDTMTLGAEPNLDISFKKLFLENEEIKAGLVMKNEEEDGEDSMFYYCEHQITRNNIMEVLGRDGDTLLIKLTAETTDVNYYDGSKPNNIIEIITYFQPRI